MGRNTNMGRQLTKACGVSIAILIILSSSWDAHLFNLVAGETRDLHVKLDECNVISDGDAIVARMHKYLLTLSSEVLAYLPWSISINNAKLQRISRWLEITSESKFNITHLVYLAFIQMYTNNTWKRS